MAGNKKIKKIEGTPFWTLDLEGQEDDGWILKFSNRGQILGTLTPLNFQLTLTEPVAESLDYAVALFFLSNPSVNPMESVRVKVQVLGPDAKALSSGGELKLLLEHISRMTSDSFLIHLPPLVS